MAVDNQSDVQSVQDRSAKIIAEILAPAVLVAVVTLTIAFACSDTILAGLLWASVSATFCSGIPIWFMARGAKSGRWDTHHVRDRKDRLIPLSVSVGSVIGGLVILIAGGAPSAMIALVLAMLCCLVLATAVTQVWKISLHAAIAAGVVAILVATFGPLWWCALVAVAGVSWSRVITGDHTVLQVAAGSVLGIVAGGGLYAALL